MLYTESIDALQSLYTMDCDVLTTTHPLISQDIYNGFNEVATYKLFEWTTLKDAKRFLWSHYNPDGVYIFIHRNVNRIKFLDKETFYVSPGIAFVIERHCIIIFRNVYNAGLQTPQRSTSTFLR